MCVTLVMVSVGRASSNEQSFVVEPEDQSAVVDSTVSLPCIVAGLAGQLQWTKDDFALGTNRNLSYHGYPRYAMTGSDANGKIICIALLHPNDTLLAVCSSCSYIIIYRRHTTRFYNNIKHNIIVLAVKRTNILLKPNP